MDTAALVSESRFDRCPAAPLPLCDSHRAADPLLRKATLIEEPRAAGIGQIFSTRRDYRARIYSETFPSPDDPVECFPESHTTFGFREVLFEHDDTS